MDPIFQYLIMLAAGGGFVLAGAIAGGWLVFKARGNDERLFGGEPVGQAFNLDDDEAPEPEAPPEVLQAQNERFIERFAAGLEAHHG